MSGIVLVVTAIAMSVSCMALGLGIAFDVFHRDIWDRWYIVFQSCIFATITLSFVNAVSSVALEQHAATVLIFIFTVMQHATTGFVAVLLPYFLRWIVKKKWSGTQRWIFYTVGICYFAAGLVGKICKAEQITSWIQCPLILGILTYTIYELWKNLLVIEDEHSRSICRAISIVTICLIPTDIAVEIFPFFKAIGYSVYVLAISIIMLVYFFIRFKIDRSRLSNSVEFSPETLSEYGISEREREVIQFICDGKTNKEIASEMNISVNTVNNHVANIFSKMKISSRVDLIRIIKEGPWS